MGVARSTLDVMAEMLALLPSGWAINASPDSVIALFLLPLAAEIVRFEAQAQAQLLEIDPGAAAHLLEDYERMLGPDPYGRDLAVITEGQRRQIAAQRWTARGGQSVAYFVALAALFGVTISIAEQRTSVCGGAVCGGSFCAPTPWQFVWIITLPASDVVTSVCGASQSGAASCGFYTPSPVVPIIQRDAPAHTTPIFSYTG